MTVASVTINSMSPFMTPLIKKPRVITSTATNIIVFGLSIIEDWPHPNPFWPGLEVLNDV